MRDPASPASLSVGPNNNAARRKLAFLKDSLRIAYHLLAIFGWWVWRAVAWIAWIVLFPASLGRAFSWCSGGWTVLGNFLPSSFLHHASLSHHQVFDENNYNADASYVSLLKSILYLANRTLFLDYYSTGCLVILGFVLWMVWVLMLRDHLLSIRFFDRRPPPPTVTATVNDSPAPPPPQTNSSSQDDNRNSSPEGSGDPATAQQPSNSPAPSETTFTSSSITANEYRAYVKRQKLYRDRLETLTTTQKNDNKEDISIAETGGGAVGTASVMSNASSSAFTAFSTLTTGEESIRCKVCGSMMCINLDHVRISSQRQRQAAAAASRPPPISEASPPANSPNNPINNDNPNPNNANPNPNANQQMTTIETEDLLDSVDITVDYLAGLSGPWWCLPRNLMIAWAVFSVWFCTCLILPFFYGSLLKLTYGSAVYGLKDDSRLPFAARLLFCLISWQPLSILWPADDHNNPSNSSNNSLDDLSFLGEIVPTWMAGIGFMLGVAFALHYLLFRVIIPRYDNLIRANGSSEARRNFASSVSSLSQEDIVHQMSLVTPFVWFLTRSLGLFAVEALVFPVGCGVVAFWALEPVLHLRITESLLHPKALLHYILLFPSFEDDHSNNGSIIMTFFDVIQVKRAVIKKTAWFVSRWLAGMACTAGVSWVVAWMRKVFRPGLLHALRDPRSPDFDPIKELSSGSIFSQFLRLGTHTTLLNDFSISLPRLLLDVCVHFL